MEAMAEFMYLMDQHGLMLVLVLQAHRAYKVTMAFKVCKAHMAQDLT